TNMNEVEKALPKIHAPGLNIMYGDEVGNVAWWATAKLHMIPDSIHTKFVQTNASVYPAKKTYIDFSENPHAINPPWNYVYSANNQPDSINAKFYPGYYLPENRAKRVVELLEPKNDWDKEAVQEMITDVSSAVNPSILTDLTNSLNIKTLSDEDIALLDLLKAWKGDYRLTTITGTVFHRWVYLVLKNAFSDEMGLDTFEAFMVTHMSKRTIAPLIDNPNSIWWDDTNTEDIEENRSDIVQKSFNQAIESLQKDFGPDYETWTWDKVHTLEHEHPIGKVAALRSFFNVGPFPVHGSREVINNLAFAYNAQGFYKVSSGPSTRRVIDFSDIENSMSILPTGQSGNPFSEHFKDQAEMYVNGEFRKMMMNKEAIQQSESVLILNPSKE
ncbi:penicillin acylase family protein, partial [bacterium]|nr:penicillin acylase family protein [bacterium]